MNGRVIAEAGAAIMLAANAGGQGMDLVDSIVNQLCKAFGGQAIHWPLRDYRRRNRGIQQALAEGRPIPAIAKRYGVSASTVRAIGQRKPD